MAKVPGDATRDVQSTVQQLNEEIEALRKRLRAVEKDESSGQSIQALNDKIESAIKTPNHQIFTVPVTFLAPVNVDGSIDFGDATILGQGVVRENVLTYRISDDDPSLKITLPGHTHVAGGLYCSKLLSGGDTHIFGDLRVSGSGPGKVVPHGIYLYNTLTFLEEYSYQTTRAHVTGTITAAYGVSEAGTSIQGNINVGGNDICSSNFTITSGSGWTDLSANQNLSISPGDEIQFDVDTVTGDVETLAIYFLVKVDS